MWRYSYEIAGGILIVLSSLVSEQMPKEWRLRMWIGFIVLALLYSGVGIHLAKQDELEQGKRDESIKELRGKFDQSTAEQQRMTGQLTAMRDIMDSFAKTGVPGFKELATAIANVMADNSKRALDVAVSDKQLCEKAIRLAQDIRTFQGKFEEENKAKLFAPFNPNLTPEQRKTEWQRESQEEMQAYQRHEVDFSNRFLGDSKYLKDLMIVKLPIAKRDALVQNNGQADSNLSVGMLAGASNEYRIANYLEEIAKTLCAGK